ncbi:MAG TPA: cytochrome c3 family protein [Lentimicrobium sp.]|nr:cytochrome c3 family protein [Lentimicrobium sp.]
MDIKAKITMHGIITFMISHIILLLVLVPDQSMAQEGKDLFQKNCTVCHTIGQGKLVGPDLQGVTKRREHAWLLKFIKNSQAVIQSGDPVAVQLFQEHSKAIMPSFTQFSDEEITSILDYIDKWEPEKVEALTVDVNKKTGFSHEEYLRGERLFYGLIPHSNGLSFNCSDCHNTVTSDTLNWNPSAMDLANSFMDPKGMNIYQSMNQPVSSKMEQAHSGIKMTEQEIYYISAFLSHFNSTQMAEHKIFPLKLILFIVFAVLMTWAIIDLLFLKRVKFKIIHAIILLAGISVHTWLAYVEAVNLSRTQNYAPDQPIKFSHKIHAGQNKTDCRYCHHTAELGKSAGIPSLNVCLNCHNVVKTGTNSGNFEINKITRAEASGRPVQWIRVHNLPDHVYFNHAQHVKAGRVACEKCHGKVQEMDILTQFSDLSMGWCVNCHRTTLIDTENNYYSIFKDEGSSDFNSPTVDNVGGIDCMKCHY